MSTIVKAVILFIFPFALLTPVGMVLMLVGTLIAMFICGRGWENLGCGLMGGLLSYAIGICLLSFLTINYLFRERSLVQKVALTILLILYTTLVIWVVPSIFNVLR
jgi:hypothetical protein